MGLNITDGKGRGYDASVSESNRLNTSSKQARRIFYVARNDARAFTATSVDADSAAGDIVFYLKNTSTTRNMFVKDIHVGGVNTSLWKFWVVTGTGSGAAITPTNTNLGSGITAEATCLGNAAVTGLTTGALFGIVRSPANGEIDEDFDGALILAPNTAIAVEFDTSGSNSVTEVICAFHYEAVDRDN